MGNGETWRYVVALEFGTDAHGERLMEHAPDARACRDVLDRLISTASTKHVSWRDATHVGVRIESPMKNKSQSATACGYRSAAISWQIMDDTKRLIVREMGIEAITHCVAERMKMWAVGWGDAADGAQN